MNKLLYFGSGEYIDRISHFKSIEQFIYVDIRYKFNIDFYNKIITKFKRYNFKLTETIELDNTYYRTIMSCAEIIIYNLIYKTPFINPTLLVFRNDYTHQIVKYYISTNIKYNMNEKLDHDIKTSNGLIISGYHPDKELLNFFEYPKSLYCYTRTSYKLDDNNQHTFLNQTYHQTNTYFDKYFCVNYDNGLITELTNINELVNIK